MKKLWEYKLDLLYYGIRITEECYKLLKKDNNGKVTFNDYITTKGLFIILNDTISVNVLINTTSSYCIDLEDSNFILKHNSNKICNITIKQAPEFALNSLTLPNGRLITDLINIHGDRIRIQPIQGCANKCRFCDLNLLKYHLNSIEDLEAAFIYAKKNVGFRHALISGGTPLNNQKDFDYQNNVYKYFGEKYGQDYPIDIMLVPRSININDNSEQTYKEFLNKLKEWNISGIYINLELYNDFYRQDYIPQKDIVGKDKYFKFIKLAVEVFGKGNVKSCIIIGIEDIEDSLKAVEELSSIGCLPVLSPYIPNDNETFLPNPQFMKDILLKAKEITDKNKVELGPTCDLCKHNTIHFK